MKDERWEMSEYWLFLPTPYPLPPTPYSLPPTPYPLFTLPALPPVSPGQTQRQDKTLQG